MSRPILLLLFLAIPLIEACEGETRTWADNSGKYKIEAELVEVSAAGAKLQKADGSTVVVPLKRLREADQQIVKQWMHQAPQGAKQAWRANYDELVAAVKTKKLEDGNWRIDWGTAAELGEWYDLSTRAHLAFIDALRTPANSPERREALKLTNEAAKANDKLKGVEWTATYLSSTQPNANSSVKIDLAPLPEPLRIIFWCDKADIGNWEQLKPGHRVTFACRFETKELTENPAIDVVMTLRKADLP